MMHVAWWRKVYQLLRPLTTYYNGTKFLPRSWLRRVRFRSAPCAIGAFNCKMTHRFFTKGVRWRIVLWYHCATVHRPSGLQVRPDPKPPHYQRATPHVGYFDYFRENTNTARIRVHAPIILVPKQWLAVQNFSVQSDSLDFRCFGIARNLLPDVFAPCRRKEKKKAKVLPGLSVLNKKIIRATTISSNESESDQRTVPSPHPSRPVPTQTVVRKMRVQRLRPAVGTETKSLSKTLRHWLTLYPWLCYIDIKKECFVLCAGT